MGNHVFSIFLLGAISLPLCRALKVWTDLSSSQSEKKKGEENNFSASFLQHRHCLLALYFTSSFSFPSPPAPTFYPAFVLLSPFLLPHPFQCGAKYLPVFLRTTKKERKMLSELCAQPEVFPKLEASEAFDLLRFTWGIPDICIWVVDAHLVLPLTALNSSTRWIWWQRRAAGRSCWRDSWHRRGCQE